MLAIVLLLAACDDDATPPHDAAVIDASVADASLTDASGCAAPNVLRFEQSGCSASPSCGSSTQDLCLRVVCSCTGKVIGGCDWYHEPWTLAAVPPGAKVGDPCTTD
jgi:hypothetical protein